MTAVPDWNPVDPRNTDAELVSGSIAGDKAAFAQIYDRYADRLHDFCVGMLRDRGAAGLRAGHLLYRRDAAAPIA